MNVRILNFRCDTHYVAIEFAHDGLVSVAMMPLLGPITEDDVKQAIRKRLAEMGQRSEWLSTLFAMRDEEFEIVE